MMGGVDCRGANSRGDWHLLPVTGFAEAAFQGRGQAASASPQRLRRLAVIAQRQLPIDGRQHRLERGSHDIRIDAGAEQGGAVGQAQFDVAGGAGVGAGADRVLVVIHQLDVQAERIDKGVDRAVAAPFAGNGGAVFHQGHLDLHGFGGIAVFGQFMGAVAKGVVCSKYSRVKMAWMSAAATSRPLASATFCTARENSICKRRGNCRPNSCSSRYAMPPLPDWLLTRMTAS